MKSESFRKLLCLLLFVVLIPFSSAFADTFTDQGDFEQAVGPLTVIDFEGFATEGGAAGTYELTGDEFAGITLTPDGDAEGLFVGIPDIDAGTNNCETFYADDFFPVSPEAVFSPDEPLVDCEIPNGSLIVDFASPTTGVGVYFLDVETDDVSSIEAFDGPGGTGNSLGILTLQNQGDDSQAFAGVAASGIKSAVIVIGGGTDGVGLDDLQFGKLQVALDIKPTSCPNPLNTKKRGVLPAAILGTENFDVTQIDVSTLRLEGVAPIRWNLEDVATPFEPFIGKELCKRDCSEAGPDGFTDLTLKFRAPEVVDTFGGDWPNGRFCEPVQITGNLLDGTPIVGEDVLFIKVKNKD